MTTDSEQSTWVDVDMKHWATVRQPPDIAQQGVRADGVVGILRTRPPDLHLRVCTLP